jgi:hypothetical protein
VVIFSKSRLPVPEEKTKMAEWMTITEAAIKLGIGPSKISRLVKSGQVQTIDDPVDKRVKLVDLEELTKLFKRHVR